MERIDLDLFVTFSVNQSQWISSALRLIGNTSNGIWPICDNSPVPTQTIPTGDVKECVDRLNCQGFISSSTPCRTRQCKVTMGIRGTNISSIIPNNLYNPEMPRKNSFPMTMSITNDPTLDQSSLKISTATWNGWIQGCGYGQAFLPDQGLQIYLAVDDYLE